MKRDIFTQQGVVLRMTQLKFEWHMQEMTVRIVGAGDYVQHAFHGWGWIGGCKLFRPLKKEQRITLFKQ